MYALTVTSRRQLERASLRAQAQKPRIEEKEFGIYNVWSTDPKRPDAFYFIAIQPARGGGYEVACGCPTQKYFCKHVASVFPHYLMREKQQELARTATAQAQQMNDSEWAAVELSAETEDILDAVREMLANDDESLCECGAPATSSEGRCNDCQVAFDNQALFG
jgi:hypothetical protein